MYVMCVFQLIPEANPYFIFSQALRKGEKGEESL